MHPQPTFLPLHPSARGGPKKQVHVKMENTGVDRGLSDPEEKLRGDPPSKKRQRKESSRDSFLKVKVGRA